MFVNDLGEMVVTKHVPGEEVYNAVTLSIKSTMGYPSGVVGGTEVAVRAKVT